MSQQTVSTSPARPQLALGIDRRTQARYSLKVPAAFCYPVAEMMDDASWKDAKVQDISSGGIALTVSRYLEPGTLLALELNGVPHLLLASVVHTQRNGRKEWTIGCAFARPLTDVELHTVV